MANIAYDSPSSLDPKTGFQPQGFLGGMQWGQRNQDYRSAVESSQLMKALGAMEEVNKLQDYQTNAPVRDAERLSKIAGFNADAATVGDIKGGEAATGRLKTAQAPAQLENQLAQWKASQSKWKQEDIDRHSNNMEAIGESLFSTPGHDTLAGQAERQAMLDQYRQLYPDLGLPTQWNAEGEQKMFRQYQMAKTLKQLKQKEELAKTQLTSETQLRGHEIDAASRLEVEQAKLKAKAEAEAKVGSIDVEINKLLAKQAKTGSLTPGEQAQLKQLQNDRIAAQAAKMVAYGLPPQILNQGPTTPEALGGAARAMAQGANNAAPSTPAVINYDAQGNRIQ